MKCPKCQYVRKTTDQAPDWQCPSCGVAYVKALRSSAPQPPTAAATPSLRPTNTALTDDEALAHQEETRQVALASGQKTMIYSLVLNFILQSGMRGQALPEELALIISIAIGLYAAWGALKIASNLGYPQNGKIVFMVLMFIPILNLVVMIYLSAQVNRILRTAGWTIGLLGAKR